jgi:predicted NUDIX family phosphoesterase
MKEDEKVLVVPSEIIFKDGGWQGIKTDNLDYYLELIKNNYQFRKRGEVEDDPSFQQIIPYILFGFEDKFFLYKYIKEASEKRLLNTYQLGVGGHINLIDAEKGDFLEAAATREWLEEINYKGNILEKKLVGILNDEARPVEKVHLGLVYHFIGDRPEISVKETEKLKGELISLDKLGDFLKNLTVGWAPIVYREYLAKIKIA